MADYNLAGLNPRDFEHLTQSLAIRYIGPGVTPFGDGPDGGREATYRGQMAYPSVVESWNGYLVIQSKFLTRPSGDSTKDGEWAITQLKSDLAKFADPKRDLPKPDYYLFVTNVVLTPTQNSGSKDKIFELLERSKHILGFKGFDVWDFDKLCRLIDGDRNVRTRFAGFITTGDVLSKVIELLEGQHPNFAHVTSIFLQKEMRADQFVKLEQAGNTGDQKTPLAQVFVDLPVSEQLLSEPSTTEMEEQRLTTGLVSRIIRAGSQILKGSLASQPITVDVGIRTRERYSPEPGRFVIVGGPGQGKSTVGQFICQLYRASLLNSRPTHSLSVEARSTLEFFNAQSSAAEIELPIARRFPVRIVLDQFATSLATGKVRSLLSYVIHRIRELAEADLSMENLRSWLAIYPWLIVLDGLDEVPPTSNRQQVLEKITEFWSEVATLDADVLVIATTRPQGYNEDFSPRFYKHLFLAPLSQKRALHYASRLIDAQYSGDPDRKSRIMTRLKMACDQATTQRLMRSPLQITIMATLVDRIGQPPQERWRLFRHYYEVIYQRETERDIPASRILQQRKSDVNAIHYRVGLLLQTESEYAGSTDSKLNSDRFYKLVYERIAEEGHEGEQLESRTKDITEAALHRLVFLVGLEENRIGFEIRSLQEFMASEALMDGKEEQVRARLEAIAPIVHWRNVFLFAAGNCFAERQFHRDMIIAICDQLNDVQNDKLAGVTLAGSRLALDILDDGVAREQPKYARSLARIAIRLLEIPDLEANSKLASVYNEQLETIFFASIKQHLDHKDFSGRLGAWAVLLSLASKDIAWAAKIAEQHWPDNNKEQQAIIELVNSSNIGKWAHSKIISLIPSMDPWRAFSGYQFRVVSAFMDQNTSGIWQDIGEDSETPSWYAAIKVLSQRQYKTSRTQHRLNTFLEPISNKRSFVTFESVRPTDDNQLKHLKDLPATNNRWLPYIAGARFSELPGQQALAENLIWLSENWILENILPSIDYIPWPLYACIAGATSQNDLLLFAKKAVNGGFGDLQMWLDAERRWTNHGISEDDLNYVNGDKWPFDNNIGNIGFPFAASHFEPYAAAEKAKLSAWEQIYSYYENFPEGKSKDWLAATLLDINHASRSTFRIRLLPNQLRDLFSRTKHRSYLRMEMIQIPTFLNEEWIDLVDWLGNRWGVFPIPRRPFTKAQPLVQAYIQNPNRRGLLLILGSLAASGVKITIPDHILTSNRFDDDMARIAACLIRVSRANWTAAEANKIARNYVDACGTHTWHLDRIGWHLETDEVKPVEQELFFLALRDILANDGADNLGNLYRSLNAIMRSRTSQLNRRKKWKELGLPILPQ